MLASVQSCGSIPELIDKSNKIFRGLAKANTSLSMYGLIKSGPTALCRLSFVRMSMMFCCVNTRMPNRLGGVFMSQYGGDVSSVFMTDAKYVFKVSAIVTGLVIFSPSTIKHSMLELGLVKFLV